MLRDANYKRSMWRLADSIKKYCSNKWFDHCNGIVVVMIVAGKYNSCTNWYKVRFLWNSEIQFWDTTSRIDAIRLWVKDLHPWWTSHRSLNWSLLAFLGWLILAHSLFLQPKSISNCSHFDCFPSQAHQCVAFGDLQALVIWVPFQLSTSHTFSVSTGKATIRNCRHGIKTIQIQQIVVFWNCFV